MIRAIKIKLLSQILVVIAVTCLMARIGVEGIELTTFAPGLWGNAQALGAAMDSHAGLMENPYQNRQIDADRAVTDRRCYGYTGETDDVVFCAGVEEIGAGDRMAPTLSRGSRIRVFMSRVPATTRGATPAEVWSTVSQRPERAWTVAKSARNPWTGLRYVKLNDMEILALGDVLREIQGASAEEAQQEKKNRGVRWLRALVSTAKAKVRLNNLLIGPIQIVIYLFTALTLIFVVIDFGFVLRNRRDMSDESLLPEVASQFTTDQIQARLRAVENRRRQADYHPEFEPPIFLDALDAGLKALLSYRGKIDRGALISTIEAQGRALQERLERRFQVVRYFVSAIPSLGFIGTVWGIGLAIATTSALAGDNLPYERLLANDSLATSLKIAFDTTLVALIIHIALSFAIDCLENWEMSSMIDIRRMLLDRLARVQRIVETPPSQARQPANSLPKSKLHGLELAEEVE